MKYTKQLIVIVFFILVFTSSFWLMGTSNDDGTHKEMARDFAYQQDYHSWFRFASQYFIGYDLLWLVMGFFITCVLTSFIVYLITKNWWSFFFFVFGSNYFLVMWGTGLYPQSLVVIFGLLLVLFRKSWWKQGLVFLLGFGVHGFAPIFLGVLWALLLFQEYLPRLKSFLVCSPVFGYNTPEALMVKVGSSDVGNHFEVGELISFFTKMCPIPFLFTAFLDWVKKREWWAIIFLVFLIIGGILQFNERTLWSFVPFMWLGFISFFEKSKHKKLWIALAFCIGIINYYFFVRLKLGVGC